MTAALAARAWAAPEGVPTTWPAHDQTHLELSAQGVARPELQYALLPRAIDLEHGNAAVKYQAAAAELPVLTDEEVRLVQDLGSDVPLQLLEQYRLQMAPIFDKCSQSLRLLRQGARMDSVNWETNISRDGINALIPSLPKFRRLVNILQTQIRLDILRHDWDGARDKLQTGYMLARHLGEGETLVESLVGVTIALRMNSEVEEWVAEPGSPNLYWPLSNIPTPFNDFHRATSSEQSFAFASIPELREMRNGRFSIELWNGMVRHLDAMSGSSSELVSKASGPLFGVAVYPEAKRYLRERGMPAAAIEKMPVAEVVGRYFIQSYEEESDGLFKWIGLPAAQSLAGLAAWDRDFQQRAAAGKVNLLARLMLPALSRAVQIHTRLDRQFAALRIIEEIRAYVAEKGRFPDSLQAVSLPLPVDPLGIGFQYRADSAGTTAVLEAAAADGADRVHYELTLRK
jgi:hypothetical protein